jgi:predicted TPR repeat methyltransferase
MVAMQEALNDAVAAVRARDWLIAEAKAREILRRNPTHVRAMHILGGAHHDRGDDLEAIRLFHQAIAIRPDFIPAYRTLTSSYMGLRRYEEAGRVFQRWAQLQPDDPEVQHMMAALTRSNTPARCSESYVKSLFNSFSASFDAVLVGGLAYRGPQLVASVLASALGDDESGLDVLDAGCGTGLCGPQVRRYARKLVGVDLAENMLDRARERACYDDLIASDLCTFMSDRPDAFDLIISADVIIYFGSLDTVLQAAFEALRTGGTFVFTLEALLDDSPDSYRLLASGRYSHRESYVSHSVSAAGFGVCDIQSEFLRWEFNERVIGLVAVAKKTMRKEDAV